MCGIAGYVSDRIADGASILEKMNRAMVHRGPDDAGIYIHGPIGLAMRRLSVIDIVGGHQPVWNENQSVVLIFNGEIYNYRDIREDLKKKGYRFSTNSDTEVLLRLYEEKGVNCLHRLNGMFAFAIYDRREDLFFAARDRMGEKPFHYYYHHNEFVFASEIKSILQCPAIDCSMSLTA